MRIQIPARIRALEGKRPSLVQVGILVAGAVAAFAGIAALRRGASPAPAGPTPFPGLSDLSSAGLGLDSGPPPFQPTGVGASSPTGVSPGGGGYDPISPVVNVGLAAGPRGIVSGTTGRVPTAPAPPSPTRYTSPSWTTSGTIGGSRGVPAPTRFGAPISSSLATIPGTPTPAGHVAPRTAAFDVAHHVAPKPVVATRAPTFDVAHHAAPKPAPARPRRVAPATWDAAHHPVQAAPSYASQGRLVRAI